MYLPVWPRVTLTRLEQAGMVKGTNFALYSENATRVELCLFDSKKQ